MKIRSLLAVALWSIASGAGAAEYPARPIRIIVTFTPGSASDLLARMFGPKLHEAWGQQVVVDNRPSAGGTVGGAIVAGATPDGHTMLLTSSAFAGSAALYDKLPYDSEKDFRGVSLIAEAALPGFEYQGWFGVLVPARTPQPVIAKLSAAIGRIAAMTDIQERIARDGASAASSTPAEFDKLVRDEIATRKKVFKAAGAKPD